MRIYQRHRELAKGCVRADAGRIILTRPVGSIFQRGITCTSTHVVFRWSVFPSCTGAKHVPVIAASWNIVLRGATTFSKLGVQFLGLGYCTEQNTDGIPSFVHCSLQLKSWGCPSKFWGVRTPSTPPVVAPLVTCGLTAYTPGSAPGPTLGIEYGKVFTFTFTSNKKSRHITQQIHVWLTAL